MALVTDLMLHGEENMHTPVSGCSIQKAVLRRDDRARKIGSMLSHMFAYAVRAGQ